MTLREFFTEHPEAAVAFSGGADSALLVWAASRYAKRVRTYYVKTPFQPAFELRDAQRLAGELSMPLTVIEFDVLSVPGAAADGVSLLLDGTNASDDAGDRPGMRAIGELSVRSPLRECGLTKEDVRRLSREAGLFTWDKPAYACLATRIPTGTAISRDMLEHVEQAEDALAGMGYRDFRVRVCGGAARLQLTGEELTRAFGQREEITRALRPWFPAVLLDLEPRQPSR